MSEPHPEVLARLGITPIALPVPFPDAGGPVNVYAIEEPDGGFCLFDTGIGGSEGQEALGRAAAERGISLQHVRRVVVSHGHVDHYGNAQHVSELSRCKVLVHSEDWDKAVGDDPWPRLRPIFAHYLFRYGVPPEGLEHVGLLREVTGQFARRIDESRAERLSPGTRLRFRHFEGEILHFPGHTPGLVCLWNAEHKVLFADDHVLARISPNPLLDFSDLEEAHKFRALVAYLDSAQKVAAMDIDWVLPGHGAPFRGHRQVLEGLFGFYEKRQEKIRAHLEATPSTAYELIPVVFGRLDPSRLFLKLSEVVGNLEVLQASGRVRRREVSGRWVFESAPPP